MRHTTLVLSIVPSFCLLTETFRPTIPQLSPSSTTVSVSPIRHAAVSLQGSTHTGGKQSCINCVQIFYHINLGHNNLIDLRVNFDSPTIYILHAHYATEHALVLIDEKIISSRKFLMINEIGRASCRERV